MLSAICFNLDQSKMLSSGKRLKGDLVIPGLLCNTCENIRFANSARK